MNLKEIMAIAGKPGLYKMVAQAKNGIIVESIIDQKRFQAFSHDKISTLEEISIYTESGDMPLREVLKTMFEKLEGKPTPEMKSDNNKAKQFFGEMLPQYDKNKVYVSHMQKIIGWYNMLTELGLISANMDEEPGSTETEGETPAAPEQTEETK
ncbi:MAG: DUF5606 domain-containing protein [Lentimicrobiaceae bacterium]